MTHPNLPFATYVFTFEACESITHTQFGASLWHGQFGRALRSVVNCVDPTIKKCTQCSFMHQCDYAFLFEGVRPPNATIMRNYETIPVPHVFQTPVTEPMHVLKQHTFSVTMQLIGKANQTLPIVIESMKNIGEAGLKKQRFKAKLNQVTLQKNTGQQVLLYANELLLSFAQPQVLTPPPCPPFIRFQWLTPFSDKSIQKLHDAEQLSLYKVFMMIIRRISLLQNFYTENILDVDFVYLKTLTQQAEKQCAFKALFLSPQRRFSASHKRHIHSVGILGYMDIPMMGIEALWPYLFAGQFLNVGSNASMGYGRYKILQVLK